MKRRLQSTLTPGSSAKRLTAPLKTGSGQFMAFNSKLRRPVKSKVSTSKRAPTVGVSSFGGMAFANFKRPGKNPAGASSDVSVINRSKERAGVLRDAKSISMYNKGTLQGNAFRSSIKTPGQNATRISAIPKPDNSSKKTTVFARSRSRSTGKK
jgi:hypothetical protein